MQKWFVLIKGFVCFFIGCRALMPDHIQIYSAGSAPLSRYQRLGVVTASWEETYWTKSAPLRTDYYYVNMALRRAAYSRWGEGVDAIVDVKYKTKVQYRYTWCTSEENCYRRLTYQAQGIAVQFISETRNALNSLKSAPDKAEIITQMSSVKSLVEDCVRSAHFQGDKIIVVMTIAGATGRVIEARVTDPQGASFSSCVESVIKEVQFSKFQKTIFSVRYPFVISQSQEDGPCDVESDPDCIYNDGGIDLRDFGPTSCLRSEGDEIAYRGKTYVYQAAPKKVKTIVRQIRKQINKFLAYLISKDFQRLKRVLAKKVLYSPNTYEQSSIKRNEIKSAYLDKRLDKLTRALPDVINCFCGGNSGYYFHSSAEVDVSINAVFIGKCPLGSDEWLQLRFKKFGKIWKITIIQFTK